MNQYVLCLGVTLYLCLGSLSTVGCQEQNNIVIACHSKKLLLVNDRLALVVGGCEALDWYAPFEVEEVSSGGKRKRNKRELQVLSAVRHNPKKDFERESLEEGELVAILNKATRDPKVRLRSSELPPSLIEFSKGTIRIIITEGPQYGDGRYEERARFTITVKRLNPTIREILDEIRRANPDRKGVEIYGEAFYLVDSATGQRLDESKTAVDYNLKSGSILRLFSDIR